MGIYRYAGAYIYIYIYIYVCVLERRICNSTRICTSLEQIGTGLQSGQVQPADPGDLVRRPSHAGIARLARMDRTALKPSPDLLKRLEWTCRYTATSLVDMSLGDGT